MTSSIIGNAYVIATVVKQLKRTILLYNDARKRKKRQEDLLSDEGWLFVET